MEREKKILILILILTGFSHADSLYINNLAKEELYFSLSHSPLAKATARMIADTAIKDDLTLLTIKAEVKTEQLAKLFFHIDNHYTSIAELPAWRLRLLSKVIDQKNIQQRWTTKFNHQDSVAKTVDGKVWAFDPKALDPFAMLYYVRYIDPDFGDSLNIMLEVESQTWTLAGFVFKDTLDNGIFKGRPVRCIDFTYGAKTTLEPREWKTDLFTNRFAQERATLLIYLGPPPVSLPVRIVFGHSENSVKMDLLNYYY